MTWFWFILFGIIILAKRAVFLEWVTTWSDDGLKKTAVIGMIMFVIGGFILVQFDSGGLWFWHIVGGAGGAFGFLCINEVSARNNRELANRIRSRRDVINNRLRETMQADESIVEGSDRARAMTEQATGQRIIAGQPPVVEAAPGPQDAEDRLLSILKQMAEDNEQDHQDEVLSAREEHQAGVESMREERAIRAQGMKVNLGTTGIYGRPQGREWQGFEPENAAAYGIEEAPAEDWPQEQVAELQAEPVEEPAVPGALVPVGEPGEEPEDATEPVDDPEPQPAAEVAAEPKPEPEPEPVAAAVDKRPPSAGPAREGYTPGPARLGGAPGSQAAGPVTLGPSKPAASGPVTLSPGFSYQPKLVDSKLDKPAKPASRF